MKTPGSKAPIGETHFSENYVTTAKSEQKWFVLGIQESTLEMAIHARVIENICSFSLTIFSYSPRQNHSRYPSDRAFFAWDSCKFYVALFPRQSRSFLRSPRILYIRPLAYFRKIKCIISFLSIRDLRPSTGNH